MGSSSPRITLSPQVWLTVHDREFFNRKARQESGFPADRDIRRQMGRDELTWPNAVRIDEGEGTSRPQAPTAK